jgi:CHAD domain-containing protein
MSYQLEEDETLGGGLRRILCDQLERAGRAAAEDSSVHKTRTHLKKARAALQLIRGDVPRHRLKQEDRRLRKIGRLVSDIRDAEVRLETVKQVRHSSGDEERFAETEELLAFELDSFLAAFSGWQDEVCARLARARATIAHWSFGEITRHQLCCNIRRVYSHGRKRLKQARKSERVKDFHELRKCAKNLRYQLRILRPLHPAVIGEFSDELDSINSHLGHAHDLAFVAERLKTLAGAGARKRGERALEALIESHRKDLQRIALALATHFYAQKPGDFAGRIAEYFDEWERAKLRRAVKPLTLVA